MNPNLNAFLAQLRIVLIVFGSILAEQGLDHSAIYKWVMFGAGSVVVLGNALWALWASFSNWRKASAIGVAAGINMTAQGKAVTDDGQPISAFSSEAVTPPKAVTIASAAEIVANFAPPSASIAKV